MPIGAQMQSRWRGSGGFYARQGAAGEASMPSRWRGSGGFYARQVARQRRLLCQAGGAAAEASLLSQY